MIQLQGILIGWTCPIFLGILLSLNFFPKRTIPLIDRIIFSFSSGLGIITLEMFILNRFFNQEYFLSLILMSVLILLVILILGAILVDKYLKHQEYFEMKTSFKIKEDWPLISIIILFILIIFLKGLLLPITNWDALYYIAFTSKWIYFNGTLPTEISSAQMELVNAYPMHVPLLQAWFYFSAGEFNDIYARAISPLYGTIFLFYTYRLCQALYDDKRTFNLAIIMLLSTPLFIWGAIVVNSDIVYGAYAVASLYFAILFAKTQNKLFLLSAGIMAAFSSWVKYNGLIFAFFIVVVIIILKPGNYEIKQMIKSLLTFILGFSLVLPFYFYNWLFLGNPVYPYLYSIFGGKNFDPWLYENITYRTMSPELTGITFWHIRVFPLLIGQLGVIQLFLSILMLLKFKKISQTEKKLWILSIGFFVIWYFSLFGPTNPWVTRFLMPLASVNSIFSAKIFNDLISKGRFKVEQRTLLIFSIFFSIFSVIGFWRPGWTHPFYIEYWISYILSTKMYIVLIILVALFISLISLFAYFIVEKFKGLNIHFFSVLKNVNFVMIKNLFLIVLVFFSIRSLWSYKYPTLLGPIPSFDEFMIHNHGDNYITIKWINDHLPQDAIILTTSNRRYYLNVEVLPADSPRVKMIYENKTLDQCLMKLKELKITHIWRVSNLDSIIYDSLEDSRYFELLFRKGENYVYKINYNSL